jgi:hypothetical protein
MLESHCRRYQFLTKEVAAFEERIAKAWSTMTVSQMSEPSAAPALA